jgi:vacuolar-type H+-ATPase subunit H
VPTGFGLNRGRLQLTGLEEPEELWERLKEATTEAQALAAANKKLVTRVQVLERKLSEVGGLTDDELVAELPKRMTRALESAQVVANEILSRARKHDAAIRQQASETAADIVRQAESRAADILRDATTQATAHILSAEGKAQEIIRAAHARRQEILAGMRTEAEALQQRIQGLRRNQDRLLQAYGVVAGTLAEARRALSPADAAVPAEAPSPLPEPETPPPVKRSRPRSEAPPLKVYDWFPAASSTG